MVNLNISFFPHHLTYLNFLKNSNTLFNFTHLSKCTENGQRKNGDHLSPFTQNWYVSQMWDFLCKPLTAPAKLRAVGWPS